ncbi:MAG: hypothetical protein EBQ48_11085, partial [Betaproteobacteria bacterium]|nr:hypothetical protein [Betaproteobacteria bacterium]
MSIRGKALAWFPCTIGLRDEQKTKGLAFSPGKYKNERPGDKARPCATGSDTNPLVCAADRWGETQGLAFGDYI